MKKNLTIATGNLTASKTNRVVTGTLLPYGEVGRTSLGKVTVTKGKVEIPRDPEAVYANSEHVQFQPLGHAVSIEETSKGLVASFKIVNTEEGDDLLERIESGKNKPMLSVELAAPVIRAGQLLSAKLAGAAFVAKGAFPSATLFASDFGDLDEDDDEDDDDEDDDEPAGDADDDAPAGDANQLTASKGRPVGNRIPRTKNLTAKKTNGVSAREFYSLLAAKVNGRMTPEMRKRLDEGITEADALFASLDHVDYSGTNAAVPYNPAPQWIDEIYSGVLAQPVISDLVGHEDLVSRQVAGFKVTTKPTGGSWAGNGASVTSTGMKTTPTTETAAYFAGGDTIGREFFDFGVDEALLALYFKYQILNYNLWKDEGVLSTVLPGSATMADNPAGLTIGAGWSQLIDGAVEVITAKGGLPTFALIEPSLYKSMLKVSATNVLGYLEAALNLEDGELSGFTLRPDLSGTLAAGNMLVGNGKQGATLYELGGSPVRAQALQIAIGSVDIGLYGYALPMLNNSGSFVLMEPYSA